MANDFKAKQIRTTQVIASGSNGSGAAILLYGSSSATNFSGGYSATMTSDVGSDVFLFVSGSIGSKGTAGSKGMTVLGGDTQISGSLFVSRPSLFGGNVIITGSLGAAKMTGSLQQTDSGLSYLVAGANVTIVSGSNGQIRISSTGGSGSPGGSDTQVQFNDGGTTFGGDSGLVYNKVTKKLSVTNEVMGSAFFAGGSGAYLTSSDGAELSLSAASTVTILSDQNTILKPSQNLDVVLPFSNGSEFGVKYVDSGPVYYNALSIIPGGGEEPRVLIGDPGYGATSATLDVLGSIYSSNIITASLGFSGSLTKLTDGRSYLVGGSNVTISSSSNGQIFISSTGGGGTSRSLFTDPANAKINATGSLALAGALGSNYVSTDSGPSVFLFVSGNIGTTSAKSDKLALFGGDVLTSGSIFLEDSAGYAQIRQSGGNLSIRNRSLAGQLVASVNTSIGNTVNFLDVRPNGMAVNTKVAILPSIFSGPANPFNSTDTSFFIGGSPGSKDGPTGGTTVVGGDLMLSGSTYIGSSNANTLYVSAKLGSDIIPDGNRTRNLGSDTARFANIFTGDLHLRNERGDYTLIEEEDCLTIRFNKNGKRYRFLLERAPEFDES